MATSTLVGFNNGAGHLQRAERTTAISCLIGFSGLLGMGLIAFAFATQIAALLMPQGGAAIEQSAHVRLHGNAARSPGCVARRRRHGGANGTRMGVAMGRAISARLCALAVY